MANVNDVFGGTYLKAADLKGTEPTVTIESVELKTMPDKTVKIDIAFIGKEKHFLANKTNSKRIAYMHGDETEVWIGKKIQLYTEMVDFEGKVMEAIRVRVAKPPVVRKPAAQFDDPVADIGETF